MLMRIVALLFCLADDAVHAACASARVRRRMMAILLPARGVGLNFLVQEAQGLGIAVLYLPQTDPDRQSDGVADALHLADCFRALAVALQMVAARLGIACRARFHGSRTPRRTLPSSPVLGMVPTPLFPDTS